MKSMRRRGKGVDVQDGKNGGMGNVPKYARKSGGRPGKSTKASTASKVQKRAPMVRENQQSAENEGSNGRADTQAAEDEEKDAKGGRQRKVKLDAEAEPARERRQSKRKLGPRETTTKDEEGEEGVADVQGLDGILGAVIDTAKAPQSGTLPPTNADPQIPEVQSRLRGNRGTQQQPFALAPNPQEDEEDEQDEEQDQEQTEKDDEDQIEPEDEPLDGPSRQLADDVISQRPSSPEDGEGSDGAWDRESQQTRPRPRSPATEAAAVDDYRAHLDREGSINSTSSPDDTPPKNKDKLRMSDKIRICIDLIDDFFTSLEDPYHRRGERFNIDEWVTYTDFRHELKDTIVSVARDEYPGHVGLTQLEKYYYPLLELERVIVKLKEAMREKKWDHSVNVFARRSNFVGDMIAQIKLLFRRYRWVDQTGKKWEDKTKKKMVWLDNMQEITRRLQKRREEFDAHMRRRAIELRERRELEEMRAVEERRELEERRRLGFIENGRNNEEEEDVDEYAMALDLVHPDDAVQEHKNDYDNGLRDEEPRRITDNDVFHLPWSSADQRALWQAMTAVLKRDDQLVWSEVLKLLQPELQEKGWRACEAEAKKIRDMVSRSGGDVPWWLRRLEEGRV